LKACVSEPVKFFLFALFIAQGKVKDFGFAHVVLWLERFAECVQYGLF
jgi:hypothetical protein